MTSSSLWAVDTAVLPIFNGRFWGSWAWVDYVWVVALAAWGWLSGLMIKQLSTSATVAE